MYLSVSHDKDTEGKVEHRVNLLCIFLKARVPDVNFLNQQQHSYTHLQFFMGNYEAIVLSVKFMQHHKFQ